MRTNLCSHLSSEIIPEHPGVEVLPSEESRPDCAPPYPLCESSTNIWSVESWLAPLCDLSSWPLLTSPTSWLDHLDCLTFLQTSLKQCRTANKQKYYCLTNSLSLSCLNCPNNICLLLRKSLLLKTPSQYYLTLEYLYSKIFSSFFQDIHIYVLKEFKDCKSPILKRFCSCLTIIWRGKPLKSERQWEPQTFLEGSCGTGWYYAIIEIPFS